MQKEKKKMVELIMSRQVSKQKHFRCPKGKLTSVCWHFEGKQFVCSLSDGSLVTYNLRGGQGKWAKQVKWIFIRTNKDQQQTSSQLIIAIKPGMASQEQGRPGGAIVPD